MPRLGFFTSWHTGILRLLLGARSDVRLYRWRGCVRSKSDSRRWNERAGGRRWKQVGNWFFARL